VHALLFDFINYRTGALYPSWAAIAEAACISESSVGRGLAKLKESGVLDWLRRAVPMVTEGGGVRYRTLTTCALPPTGRATSPLPRLRRPTRRAGGPGRLRTRLPRPVRTRWRAWLPWRLRAAAGSIASAAVAWALRAREAKTQQIARPSA
jgi:hypothetical protein